MSKNWKWDRQQREQAQKQSRRPKAKLQGKPDSEPEPSGNVVNDSGTYAFNMGGYVSGYVPMQYFSTAITSAMGSLFAVGPEAPREPLPVREQVDTIIAYKRAAITTDPLLYGVGLHAPYKPEDVARCVRGCNWTGSQKPVKDCPCGWCKGQRHDAPHENCHCGFYAMDKTMLGRLGNEYHTGIADLQVELSGKVIRHRDGYRAQYQRVLGVFIDPACRVCRRAASVLAVKPKVSDPIGVTTWYAMSFSFLSSSPKPEATLSPLCSLCGPDKGATFTPADLANAWGIEVTWGSIQ